MYDIGSLAIMAEAAPAAQQQQMRGWEQIVFFLPMIVIFYFLLIRPQQKKAKEHAAMLKTVKAGDKVLTSGGIIGIVVTVRDSYLTIRSADTKLEIAKSAVAEITERGGQSSDT